MDSVNEWSIGFRKTPIPSMNNPITWLRQRELNLRRRPFSQEETTSALYHSLSPVGRLPNDCLTERCGHGGIFGMNFSPDGSILAAACEKKTLLFMDPLTRSIIRSVEHVHSDCVNSVKFLDSRLFATCSDDHTVKLWDFRWIKEHQPIRILRGHTNWVKNIEYVADEGVLLTSGFDNAVLAWDINRYVENPGDPYNKLFYTPGLIRMCLTKDLSKMIISTQWGYLFVVHNFDIHTCAADLRDFKPNVCWLMIKSDGMSPRRNTREAYIRRFEASRNRTELIVDFPENNDAENITAVTPHPHGWCVLSRNTNAAENAEWTCVHDIQLPPVDELIEDPDWPMSDRSSSTSEGTSDDQPSTSRNEGSENDQGAANAGFDIRLHHMESNLTSFSLSHRYGLYRNAGPQNMHRHTARMSTGGGVLIHRNARMSVPPSSGFLHPVLWARRDSMRTATGRQRLAHLGAIYLGGQGDDDFSDSDGDELVPKTCRRLTHYIEEANVGRGFIKEQSFSFDGRLIASPFGFGVRLLAFDEKCSELSKVSPLRDCEPSLWPESTKKKVLRPTRIYETRSRTREMAKKPEASMIKAIRETKKKPEDVKAVQLHEVGMHVSHTSAVLCAQFSPTHYLLATGCYNGKVAFHQPVL